MIADAIEALAGAGDLDPAARLADRLHRCQAGPVAEALAARGRGALAAARGDNDAAAAELASALTKAYAKLGIRSRTQLAARLHRT